MLAIEQTAINKYGQEFVDKTKNIANWLGVNYTWLLAIMKHESGIDSQIQNSIGCVGLIQFCPISWSGLNTSGTALKSMSALEQLDYVYKYYKPYANRMKNVVDLGLVTFYPYALGKPDDYVFGSQVSDATARLIATQNKVFDLDNDGYITLAEYKEYMCGKFYQITGVGCGDINLGIVTIPIEQEEKKN